MFHVSLYNAVLSVPCDLVIAFWEWLLCVVVLLVFHVVSRVGCGAWLYQLLSFTLNNKLHCICIKYLSASKDIDKPANMRSLIDASAFLTVLHCTSF